MDIGNFNLFIKMIREEYALSEDHIETLRHRLLADDKEFEKVWRLYKNKSAKFRGGVDQFKFVLHDLLN
jgi:hypothetical protein